MDVSVNKPAKDFLKRRFEDWYTHSNWTSNLRGAKRMVKWMVKMAEYFAKNPQIIVNGFVRAEIAGALDGHQDEQEEQESEEEYKTESDFEDRDVIEITDEEIFFFMYYNIHPTNIIIVFIPSSMI